LAQSGIFVVFAAQCCNMSHQYTMLRSNGNVLTLTRAHPPTMQVRPRSGEMGVSFLINYELRLHETS